MLNKVMLIGHLGRDPEGRNVGGGRVVNFSLATSESWRDKNTGEKKEKTEWHNIVIWNEALGKIAEMLLRKGSKAFIEGSLQTRKWQDQNGNDRYMTEVVLQKYRGGIELLSQKDGDGGSRAIAPAQAEPDPAEGLDDEIPF